MYRAVASRNNGRRRQRRFFEMIDSWTKISPSGKTVTFKIEGDRKSGFMYSAKMDGRDIREIKGFLEELTREGVEVMFANYVAGK
jgi:hypothetical protein